MSLLHLLERFRLDKLLKGILGHPSEPDPIDNLEFILDQRVGLVRQFITTTFATVAAEDLT